MYVDLKSKYVAMSVEQVLLCIFYQFIDAAVYCIIVRYSKYNIEYSDYSIRVHTLIF